MPDGMAMVEISGFPKPEILAVQPFVENVCLSLDLEKSSPGLYNRLLIKLVSREMESEVP